MGYLDVCRKFEVNVDHMTDADHVNVIMTTTEKQIDRTAEVMAKHKYHTATTSGSHMANNIEKSKTTTPPWSAVDDWGSVYYTVVTIFDNKSTSRGRSRFRAELKASLRTPVVDDRVMTEAIGWVDLTEASCFKRSIAKAKAKRRDEVIDRLESALNFAIERRGLIGYVVDRSHRFSRPEHLMVVELFDQSVKIQLDLGSVVTAQVDRKTNLVIARSIMKCEGGVE